MSLNTVMLKGNGIFQKVNSWTYATEHCNSKANYEHVAYAYNNTNQCVNADVEYNLQLQCVKDTSNMYYETPFSKGSVKHVTGTTKFKMYVHIVITYIYL